MKVQFDRNLRTDKNRQCITGGIFYCRDSASFSVSAINKLSCNLTAKCFEIGNCAYRKPLYFLSNLLLKENYSLKNREMHIQFVEQVNAPLNAQNEPEKKSSEKSSEKMM
jgi:hypothetical protein